MKLQGKDQFLHQNQASFILKANVKQVIRSFPYTRWKSPLDTWKKKQKQEITGRPAWKILPLVLNLGKIDKSLQLVSCPFTHEPEMAPQELQLELIDLQCDTVFKEKFNSVKQGEFYASLSAAKFPNIQKMAQRMLVLFVSTYVSEQQPTDPRLRCTGKNNTVPSKSKCKY